MKTWLLGALMVVVSTALVVPEVEAKRFGSGRSSGMQRDMPARTAPDAPPAKPATPAQATPNAANAAAAGAAPAAAAKRSWMGPIAGLAAGLGLAALMSHLGLGEGFANFLMIILLALAAFFVIRLLMRRFGPQPAARTSMQYAGASGSAGPAGAVAWPAPAAPGTVAPPARLEPATVAQPISRAFVPASFDTEGFSRIAKMIFIRLQAVNDTRDLNDLRSFTTPEMYAEIRLQWQDRSDAAQHTDVLRVESEVLDVADEGARQVVSVRFHGQVREEAGGPLTDFDEVWHLVKPADDSANWAIAGIEQAPTPAH